MSRICASRVILVAFTAALLAAACTFDTTHLDQLRGPDSVTPDADAAPDVPFDLEDLDVREDAVDAPDLVEDLVADPDVTQDPDAPVDVVGDPDASDLPVEDAADADAQQDAVDIIEEPDLSANQPPVLTVTGPSPRRVEVDRQTLIPGISVTDPDVAARISR